MKAYKICIMVVVFLGLTGCATYSGDRSAMYRQAEALYRSDQCNQALPLLVRLSEELESDTRVQFWLGNCLSDMGDPAGARRAWRRALMADPLYEGAWHNLVYMEIQEAAVLLVEMREHVGGDNQLADNLDALIGGILSEIEKYRVAQMGGVATTKPNLPQRQPAVVEQKASDRKAERKTTSLEVARTEKAAEVAQPF